MPSSRRWTVLVGRLPGRARALALLGGAAGLLGCGPSGGDDLASRSLAVTFGDVDDGHPAVVALSAETGTYCSGILVSSRVVVTAGHCLLHDAPRTVDFHVGQDVRSVGVLDFRRDLGFDWDTLDHDIGVLLLDEPAPAGVEPVALQEGPLDDGVVGVSVRVVGFGLTENAGMGTRREGTSIVTVLWPDSFLLGPSPSLMCNGDSGGAVLLERGGTEVLVGVGSSGDGACEDHTTVTRVDVHLGSLIKPYVEATAQGAAGIGQRCFFPESCREGACVPPDDTAAFSYCTIPCDPGPCPAGMVCGVDGSLAGTCRHPAPEPGALSASCETDHDCASDLCARPALDAPWRCSERCFPSNEQPCLVRYECLTNPDAPSRSACFLLEESAVPGEDDSGCSVASARPLGSLGWLLLALGASAGRARKRWYARREAR